MDFERNISPKASIGIGLEADSVPVDKVYGQINLEWKHKHYHRSEHFKLRKKWFVPKYLVLRLLEKEKIRAWKIQFLFRAIVDDGDIEKFFKVLFPWVFILSKVRRTRNSQPMATINLSSKWNIEEEGRSRENSQISFSITTHDLERIKFIRERNGDDAEIKGVIHKRKVYPIKSGNKDLI